MALRVNGAHNRSVRRDGEGRLLRKLLGVRESTI